MFRQGNIAGIWDKLYTSIQYLRLSVSFRHYHRVTRFRRIPGWNHCGFHAHFCYHEDIVQTQSLLISATVSLSRNVRRGVRSAGHRRHEPCTLPIERQTSASNLGENFVKTTEGIDMHFAGLCAFHSRSMVKSPKTRVAIQCNLVWGFVGTLSSGLGGNWNGWYVGQSTYCVRSLTPCDTAKTFEPAQTKICQRYWRHQGWCSPTATKPVIESVPGSTSARGKTSDTTSPGVVWGDTQRRVCEGE